MFRHIRKLHKNHKNQIIKNFLDKVFGKYLFWTNVVSSGVLLGVGDLIQQEIEFQRKILPERYDYTRAAQMTLIGLVQGPFLHYFYDYLDKLIPKRNLNSITKKVLIDQLTCSPIVILTFFIGTGLLERKSYYSIEKEIKDKFLILYSADWIVWLPVQFLNFYYLQQKHRVIFINFVTMIFNIFVSYVKHTDKITVLK